MTELLDQALAAARSLSLDLQEEQAAVGRISADPAHAEPGHYTLRRKHEKVRPEAQFVRPVRTVDLLGLP